MTCAPINADNKFSGPWTMNASEKYWTFEPDFAPGLSYRQYFFGNQDHWGTVKPYTFYITNFSSSYEHGYKPL
jgi:hypothetical protein